MSPGPSSNGTKPPRGRIALLGILVAQAALILWVSRSTPVGEGPDELSHLQFSAFLLREHRLPMATGDPLTTLKQAQHPPLYYLLGALVAAGSDIGRLELAANPFFSANLEDPRPVPNIHLQRPGGRPGAPSPAPGIAAARRMRLLSLAAGILVSLATWRLARDLLPARPDVALAAAAFVAFLPSFVFAASVFSNDMAANAAAAWTLVAAARIARGGAGRGDRLLAGVALGLALLSKLTAVPLVAVVALAIVMGRGPGRAGMLALPGNLATAFLPAVLLFGWWPVRNALHVGVGDALGWRRFMTQTQSMSRGMPLSEELPVYLRVQWQTLLGRFGWVSVPQPGWVYAAGGALALLIGIGLAIAWRRGDRRTIAAAALACGLVYLAVLRLAFSLNLVAAHARYLFGALAPFGLLVAMGWDGLWPARNRAVGLGLGVSAMLVWSIAVAGWVIGPAFRLPDPIAHGAGDADVRARFDEGILLHGRPELDPGGAGRPPRLWLEASLTQDLTDRLNADEAGLVVFAQLIDGQDRKAAQADAPPFEGRHPFEAWAPGERYRWPLDLEKLTGQTEGPLDLLLGIYPEGEPNGRLAAFDPDGHPLPDRALRIPAFLPSAEPAFP